MYLTICSSSSVESTIKTLKIKQIFYFFIVFKSLYFVELLAIFNFYISLQSIISLADILWTVCRFIYVLLTIFNKKIYVLFRKYHLSWYYQKIHEILSNSIQILKLKPFQLDFFQVENAHSCYLYGFLTWKNWIICC